MIQDCFSWEFGDFKNHSARVQLEAGILETAL